MDAPKIKSLVYWGMEHHRVLRKLEMDVVAVLEHRHSVMRDAVIDK
jgi:hypothetical protein